MDGSALQHIREADLHARSAELVVDGQSLLIAHVHIHSVEPILDSANHCSSMLLGSIHGGSPPVMIAIGRFW